MSYQINSSGDQFKSLEKRAKELNCLYAVEEILKNPEATIPGVCEEITRAIPAGCQHPDLCGAKITLEGKTYKSPEFREEHNTQSATISVEDKVIGEISVCYIKELPTVDRGPFLKEEVKLIEIIAALLGQYVHRQQTMYLIQERQKKAGDLPGHKKGEWQVDLDLLQRTDNTLYLKMSQKMLNHLCWMGVPEAEDLRRSRTAGEIPDQLKVPVVLNYPCLQQPLNFSIEFSNEVFSLAESCLSEDEILTLVQKWLQESKLYSLVKVLDSNRPIADIIDVIRRYHLSVPSQEEPYSAISKGVQVSLIRQFLSAQFEYINIAKNYINITDFYELLQKVIFSEEGHGKLGGKAACSFLACQIVQKSKDHVDILRNLRFPKTWYITSDMALRMMHYNSFYEIVEQKYKEIAQIRSEYPFVIQTFKDAHLPPELLNGLSIVLDEFSDNPLIVRSSSLLEDQFGIAFSGKYRSIFVANQGSKQERLTDLSDAIAGVYASTFSPDPMEYRAEMGLLDFSEEMGIIIQEVVGRKIGDYFLPLFSGIASSMSNSIPSGETDLEDYQISIIPGIKTDVFDSTSEDKSVLVVPNNANLGAKSSSIDILRPSLKAIKVVNLKSRKLETIDLNQLLKADEKEIPNLEQLAWLRDYKKNLTHLSQTSGLDKDKHTATAEESVFNATFVEQVKTTLKLLEDKLGTPVSIQFASDDKDLYLLQCRSQAL